MNLNSIIKFRSNYNLILKNIVLRKLVCLGGKKRISEQLKKIEKIQHLNSIYRTMDKISVVIINKIQANISYYNKSLLNNKINILFYDATTIYFGSFTDDELKKLGHNKALKFNQPQINFTMLITDERLPVETQI